MGCTMHSVKEHKGIKFKTSVIVLSVQLF